VGLCPEGRFHSDNSSSITGLGFGTSTSSGSGSSPGSSSDFDPGCPSRRNIRKGL
jgi:hypothetical protein